MPFYEYTCSKCGHHHEELQKVSDPPLRKCPECGRNSLTRLVSAPVFRLKGGGWYSDLYSSAKPATAKDGDGAGGGGESKPESKPEPKADAKPAAKTKSGKKGTRAQAA